MTKKLLKLILVIVSVMVVSCGQFGKLLKSNDYDLKYTKAFEYYEQGKYDKAVQLFEQIMPVYKGLEKGEKVMYYYTQALYKNKDYYTAGYYFRKFAQTYPHSDYTEEAMFLGAYCYYLDSPKPSLDQESTNMAISEFELFLSKFPSTPRRDTCNNLLDELRYKLQTKSYDNAYLYYKLGYYKAANISLKNSLKDYPDSPYKEEILYYAAKAMYNYADKSVPEKQQERFNEAKKDIAEYLKSYPNGKYVKDIKKLKDNTNEYLTITGNK